MKVHSNHTLKPRYSRYQVVIVGGGIVGAGIFRDLCLHGVKTLIVDKGDFSSQTSWRSSKMLHGGLRYLENLDFFLIWEALHEKNLWCRLCPHLAQERPFHLLAYKESKYPLWMNAIAVWVYDFLSGFQNTSSKVMGKKSTLQHMPQLKKNGLSGSALYYDAVTDDNKLALESIYDGVLSNGQALNYFEVCECKTDENGFKLRLQDKMTGAEEWIMTDQVVFATGPFTDQLMMQLGLPWKKRILPSKGSHILLKRDILKIDHVAVIQTKDGRLLFVIPREDGILVGTTEIPAGDNYFDIQASDKEINYLLENIQTYFPEANVSQSDIIASYAGVRPLVSAGSNNLHKTSRYHKVIKPQKGMYVIIGGKLTTFRTMARTVAKPLIKSLGLRYMKHLTLERPRQKSVVTRSTEMISDQMIKDIIDHELVRTIDDIVLRRLNIMDSEKIGDFYQKLESC